MKLWKRARKPTIGPKRMHYLSVEAAKYVNMHWIAFTIRSPWKLAIFYMSKEEKIVTSEVPQKFNHPLIMSFISKLLRPNFSTNREIEVRWDLRMEEANDTTKYYGKNISMLFCRKSEIDSIKTQLSNCVSAQFPW